jgi:ABC-type polysaccharide/polyol phosphate export permease
VSHASDSPQPARLAPIDDTTAPAFERAADSASVAGLVWTLIRTDFKARYHGTLSGFVWALLKPLSMFVVLTSVFSLVFTTDEDYRLDLILGLFLWEFFAEGTKIGLTSLHAKGFLLTKARFPTWILVVTSLSNPLITVSVFATLLTVFLSMTGRAPSLPHLGLFGAYLLAMTMIVVGISLAGSVLFLRYRDLNQVWDVVTQAGFFFAPIIYPLGVIPERYHFYLYAWPPTAVIEFSRTAMIERQVPSAIGHLDLALVAFGVLLFGVLVYRRFAPRVAEYV